MRSSLSLPTLALAAAGLGCAIEASPQPLTLDGVMRRCEQYVSGYEPRLSRVVAREEYVQKLSVEGQPGYRSRRLVSEFLFLRLPGERGSWMGIREVREVDGEGVPAESRRLAAIAGASHGEIEWLAEQLAHENARYNLGGFVRTVNVPLIVASWLHPGYRGHFAFSRAGIEEMDGTRAWRVEFRERERPTIIRTPPPERQEVVSRGTIWLDPDTGRILQTELRNSHEGLEAVIRVRFGRNEALGIMVPIWMREEFTRRKELLDAQATYSDFRRFDVLTKIK